jgi:hypothetical protein
VDPSRQPVHSGARGRLTPDLGPVRASAELHSAYGLVAFDAGVGTAFAVTPLDGGHRTETGVGLRSQRPPVATLDGIPTIAPGPVQSIVLTPVISPARINLSTRFLLTIKSLAAQCVHLAGPSPVRAARCESSMILQNGSREVSRVATQAYTGAD